MGSDAGAEASKASHGEKSSGDLSAWVVHTLQAWQSRRGGVDCHLMHQHEYVFAGERRTCDVAMRLEHLEDEVNDLHHLLVSERGSEEGREGEGG